MWMPRVTIPLKRNVLRFENDKQRGPYRWSGSDVFWWMLDHGMDDIHPNPSEEGLKNYYKHACQCGFTDLAQLQHWFTPMERRDMLAEGFAVNLLQIDPDEAFFQAGARQCVFKRSVAKLIRPMTEREIFNDVQTSIA